MAHYVFNVGGFIAVALFLWRIHINFENKIFKVYKRFDEFKRLTENNFVRKDMCKVLENTNSQAIKDLKEEMKTGFNRMSDKIDEIIKGKEHV
jgi:hypothetical protein